MSGRVDAIAVRGPRAGARWITLERPPLNVLDLATHPGAARRRSRPLARRRDLKVGGPALGASRAPSPRAWTCATTRATACADDAGGLPRASSACSTRCPRPRSPPWTGAAWAAAASWPPSATSCWPRPRSVVRPARDRRRLLPARGGGAPAADRRARGAARWCSRAAPLGAAEAARDGPGHAAWSTTCDAETERLRGAPGGQERRRPGPGAPGACAQGARRHASTRPSPATERLYREDLLATDDVEEGVRAFLEKRPPRWRTARPMRTLIYNTRMVVPMDDARSRLPERLRAGQGRPDRARWARGPPPADVKIERFVDARGKIALPGLVNTHHHLPQTLTRNVPPRAGGAALPLAHRAVRGLARHATPPRWRSRRGSAWASCCSPAARPPPTTCTCSRAARTG